MYPDDTNRHYTIKKMFNRSKCGKCGKRNAECFFSRQSLPSLPRYCPLCAVASFPPCYFSV
nr:unnamed protein product [Callosobruchus analis]